MRLSVTPHMDRSEGLEGVQLGQGTSSGGGGQLGPPAPLKRLWQRLPTVEHMIAGKYHRRQMCVTKQFPNLKVTRKSLLGSVLHPLWRIMQPDSLDLTSLQPRKSDKQSNALKPKKPSKQTESNLLLSQARQASKASHARNSSKASQAS